ARTRRSMPRACRTSRTSPSPVSRSATTRRPKATRSRSPRTHTAQVTVDPLNTIRESDETNNTGMATFFIKGNKVKNSSFETASTTSPSQPANWTPSGTGTRYDVTGGHAADGFAAAGIAAGAIPGQAGQWASDAIAVVP